MNTLRSASSGKAIFRRMQLVDLDAVMRNETRAYAFPWTRGVFSECLTARYQSSVMYLDTPAEEQQIIGHAVLTVAAGEAHLLNVCVDRDCQGEGYGRQLVVHMLDLARSLAVEVVFLEVRPSNRVAVSLYDSLGFNEIGIRKNYYPAHLGHEDARVFALQLDLG